MSLNSSKEDSDHLSKLQEQNRKEHEDAAEEVEDSGKRKRQPDQRKYTKETEKKKQAEETDSLLRFTSAWLFISRVYKL